ncbi:MAG: hypothetical protein COT84_05060 [Chlamydiae bacterium CG10_big_fil_rev_8_21_14_0_10_35_9]|nr:MAG: hypothetical protein COT84_05060 [Chlamydiae bacterium CG10_big_fil_rev_8_21_14_0_10_35_9]
MGCFLMGATGKGITKHPEALLGSVSDNPYDVRTFLKIVHEPKLFTHIGTELTSTTERTLEERGYFARLGETTRGVNEKGLSFTSAIIFEKDTLSKPSNFMPFADVTEFIMKNCKSVDEAIHAFSSQKAIYPAYSVLLADSEGTLAHIEAGSYGTSIYRKYSADQPGITFAVNCYLSKDFIKYNAPTAVISNIKSNNKDRFEQGEILAKKFKGLFSVESLKACLSDHSNSQKNPLENPVLDGWGYSICNHGTRQKDTYPPNGLPWGTVSSEILQPSKKLFWYAYGWPCGQKPEYGDQIFQENFLGHVYSIWFY